MIFYDSLVHKRVRIRHSDDVVITGKLISIDGYLNLALESVLIYEEGKKDPSIMNTTYIKGSNVESMIIEE